MFIGGHGYFINDAWGADSHGAYMYIWREGGGRGSGGACVFVSIHIYIYIYIYILTRANAIAVVSRMRRSEPIPLEQFLPNAR